MAWALLSAACAARVQPGIPALYRGHYAKRFEVDSLAPCGIAEEWWVDDPRHLLRPHVTRPDGTVGGEVQVEIEGTVSELGTYGHLGAYDRSVTVHEVLRVAAPQKAACDE